MRKGVPNYELPGGGTVEFTTEEARVLLEAVQSHNLHMRQLVGNVPRRFNRIQRRLEAYLNQATEESEDE